MAMKTQTGSSETLHAVRFAHETGLIFTEPIPRDRATRLAARLVAMGLPAKVLQAGEESDVQPIFSRAEWDDRCVLVIGGIGMIALVRVPVDVVLPEQPAAGPLAAVTTAAGRDLAGLSGDNRGQPTDHRPPEPCGQSARIEPGRTGEQHRTEPQRTECRGGSLVLLWLAWTIHVLAGAVETVEGVTLTWFFGRPQRPVRRR